MRNGLRRYYLGMTQSNNNLRREVRMPCLTWAKNISVFGHFGFFKHETWKRACVLRKERPSATTVRTSNRHPTFCTATVRQTKETGALLLCPPPHNEGAPLHPRQIPAGGTRAAAITPNQNGNHTKILLSYDSPRATKA